MSNELIGSLRHMARLKNLSGWGANAQKRMDEAATALEAAQREADRWKASALAARAQRDGLWDTLSWIDNFDPETTAAAEKQFGFDLSLRAFLNEQLEGTK